MTYQTRLIDASHVSVCRWVHAMRRVVSRVPVRERKVVAMGETKLKINGRQVFVWAAMDTDTRELLAVYASYYRSSINSLVFIKRVMQSFMSLFITWHNHFKKHQGLGRTPLEVLS